MIVAQIVSSLDLRHGGPSRSVRGLASGLAALGEQVELLTTYSAGETPPEQPAEGPRVRAFSRQPPEALARSKQLQRHLVAQAYDIVHHHGLWLRTLHYAHHAARLRGAPLVVSPRGMMSPWAWRHRRWKKMLAASLVHPGAFASVKGWHATCEAEAADIRRLGFTQPICVAPNGVAPPDPAAEATSAQMWRTLLPAVGGRRVALFYSRLHSKKRVIELIDLWLSRSRDDWLLLIVGIPEQYSVSQLDAHLERSGARDRVMIKDGSHLPPPYAIASLFVLPSHSENFGLVVAEALVRGVPVLTTDTTPWQQLDARGAGRCVPWKGFGAALDEALASSAEALAESGARARAWAIPAFSWHQVAHTVRTFYQELAGR